MNLTNLLERNKMKDEEFEERIHGKYNLIIVIFLSVIPIVTISDSQIEYNDMIKFYIDFTSSISDNIKGLSTRNNNQVLDNFVQFQASITVLISLISSSIFLYYTNKIYQCSWGNSKYNGTSYFNKRINKVGYQSSHSRYISLLAILLILLDMLLFSLFFDLSEPSRTWTDLFFDNKIGIIVWSIIISYCFGMTLSEIIFETTGRIKSLLKHQKNKSIEATPTTKE